jgi:hypothetical protein
VNERTALWYLEAAREMGNLGLISFWTEGPVDPHLLPDRGGARRARAGTWPRYHCSVTGSRRVRMKSVAKERRSRCGWTGFRIPARSAATSSMI